MPNKLKELVRFSGTYRDLQPAEKNPIRGVMWPGRYIQGPGAIHNLGKYMHHLKVLYGCDKVLVAGGKTALSVSEKDMLESLSEEHIDSVVEVYKGDSTKSEVARLAKLGEWNKVKGVIGVGGGRAIDSARLAAHYLGVPLISVPTVASTDSPVNPYGTLYDDEGDFECFYYVPLNPHLVVADTEIMVKAPSRYFVAGMGAVVPFKVSMENSVKTCAKRYELNMMMPMLFRDIPKTIFDNYMKYGLQAKMANDLGVITPPFELCVEMNFLGVRLVPAGNGVAHGFLYGFRILGRKGEVYQRKKPLNGEIVAFGGIVEMAMTGYPTEEIIDYIRWLRSVELPTVFEDLGLERDDEKMLRKIAEESYTSGSVRNMPFHTSPQKVYDAMLVADALGHYASKGDV